MSNLYLVRHGQASFGSRDYDQLSSLGIVQSELLGQWLASTSLRPDCILHGSLTRQQRTARICLDHWLVDSSGQWSIREDSSLNEFDHRDVLLRSNPEFAEPDYLEHFLSKNEDGRSAFQKVFAKSVARWISRQHDAEYKESWMEFRQRCVTGLQHAAEDNPTANVWLFTSGGPIAAITQHVLGIPDDRILELNWSILNAGITQFSYQSGQFRLKQFNNVAHLQQANRPELLTYR